MKQTLAAHLPLGKKSKYIDRYCPSLLCAIPRAPQRKVLGVSKPLLFRGMDAWLLYELSWLNREGKPIVAVGQLTVPCDSPNLVESKSLKLYLHSFNNTQFKHAKEVAERIQSDLTAVTGSAAVEVTIEPRSIIDWNPLAIAGPRLVTAEPMAIDHLAVSIDDYQPNAALLQTMGSSVETAHLYSDLLKSHCPVTEQPDWAQIHIAYTGPKISRTALLKYIISYRHHREFHEQCVERIFTAILQRCQPSKLEVWALYTRRGGIAICPYRCL